jgi:hypothetical protein
MTPSHLSIPLNKSLSVSLCFVYRVFHVKNNNNDKIIQTIKSNFVFIYIYLRFFVLKIITAL